MHYDNHADPVSLRHEHYGWTTRFDHDGAQLDLPARLGLILQWMDGRRRVELGRRSPARVHLLRSAGNVVGRRRQIRPSLSDRTTGALTHGTRQRHMLA